MGRPTWLEKPAKDERVQIAGFVAIGFALVVGLYQGVVIKHIPGRTKPQEIAYLFEAMWEAAFFGFGLGFCVVYGIAIRSVESGPLRRRCIGIWIAISYFLCPGGHTLPHISTSHHYRPETLSFLKFASIGPTWLPPLYSVITSLMCCL